MCECIICEYMLTKTSQNVNVLEQVPLTKPKKKKKKKKKKKMNMILFA